jgi:hypothetical protein
MANIKRLNRIKDILYNRYIDEIIYEGDWMYNLKSWTFNFVEETDFRSVVAYRVIDNETQWNDFIVLEKYVNEWRKIA